MSIGSHSCSHPKMIDLAPADIESELAVSKAKIEEYLGGTCRHFCVPYGTPGLHYEPEEIIQHVVNAGYVSLATGFAVPAPTGSNPIVLERDQLLAGAGNYQHRYFLGGIIRPQCSSRVFRALIYQANPMTWPRKSSSFDWIGHGSPYTIRPPGWVPYLNI